MREAKLVFVAIFMIVIGAANAQVAINKNGAPPDSSAILDLNTTSGGFLPPRMTLSQRDSIPNPGQALLIYCTDCGTYGQLQLYNGSKWTDLLGGPAESNVPTVFNPVTGRYWMAMNLGASQVADSSTDTAAYGDLYQWGRLSDGHQKRSSGTTQTLSGSDVPGHSKFIIVQGQPYDWRAPQNVNLWVGVSGINNPCPSGYRIPTKAEWDSERASWATGDANGAFGSPLKLTLAGNRSVITGEIGSVGAFGNYWVRDITGSYSYYLEFGTTVGVYGTYRGYGSSVRCIKD